MEFDFKLTYRLSVQQSDSEWLMERLAAAGCSGALVRLGVPGQVELEFRREAPSLEQAILSAMADMQRALPGAVFAAHLGQALASMPNVGRDDDFGRSSG